MSGSASARPWVWGVALALLAVGLGLLGLMARELMPPASEGRRGTVSTDPVADAAQIARGAYLARLGNCAACHTARGGLPWAGGRPIETPFGEVFAGNLTPDVETGLGAWNADDFWQALHHGRSRDGRLLLPAFPFTAFTHVRREDSDALWAYLSSLAPVRQATPAHRLRFPYGTPWAQALWRVLYFSPNEEAASTPAPPAAASVQRGAYLVQGLGHCGACHTPRTVLGGPAGGAQAALSGSTMPGEPWWAPALALGPEAAAAQAMAELLKTGQNSHGSVSGPMAEVVQHSTQHWRDEDLMAVALFLQNLPQVDKASTTRNPASAELMRVGQGLYTTHCADCHGAQGQGATVQNTPGSGRDGVWAYPPLAGNPTVLQPSAAGLMLKVRQGGFGPVTAAHPQPYGMPPLSLSDADMAAVLSFVRQSWGNQASAVSELDVWRWQSRQ
ncbi:MAG: alcohol dehydrogenase [Ideonella sp. MAG2]|nr:MAG: alcohol dehydrogenase [Ideonella sp. MAG2]